MLKTHVKFLLLNLILLNTNIILAQSDYSMPDINRMGPLLSQGKVQEALALSDSIISEDNAHIGAATWRGYVYYSMGEFEKAIENWHKANLFGIAAYQYTLFPMASAYANLGKKEEALQLLSQAIEVGTLTKQRILGDKALASLEKMPSFQNILKRIEKISKDSLKDLSLNQHILDWTAKMNDMWKRDFPEYDLTSILDVSLPDNYEADNSHPVLIWINPVLQQNSRPADEKFKSQSFQIWRSALPRDWIIASPAEYNSSKINFEKWGWSSGEGIIVIESVIQYLQDQYAIDPSRIFLGGYQTAGNMIWHFAQAQPDKIAGFISFGGNPAMLDQIKMNTQAVNFRNANFLAFNGKKGAYDPNHIDAYKNSLKKVAPNVQWKWLKGNCHFEALKKESSSIASWLKRQKLNLFPNKIEWQTGTSYPNYLEAFWLRVDKISNKRTSGIFPNLPLEPQPFNNHDLIWTFSRSVERTQLGTNMIRVYENGSLDRAGIKRGDFIQKIEDFQIDANTKSSKINFLFNEKKNKKVRIEYFRGGVKAQAQIDLNPYNSSCFYYSDLAPRIEVEKRSNDVFVKTDGITAFTLFIHPEMFDINKGISVSVNGKKVVDRQIIEVKDQIFTGEKKLKKVGMIRVNLENKN